MPDENSRKAFTEIFERESDKLFRFCLWRVSDRDKAIDISQESFARLWGKIGAGIPVPNPEAFLYAVAKNLIVDWYRRRKSLSLEALSMDEERPFEPKDESAQAEIEMGSDARRVIELFEQIDEQYREVMRLRFIEDLPPREIADLLHLTPNAVSIRIHRGLQALRELSGIDTLE